MPAIASIAATSLPNGDRPAGRRRFPGGVATPAAAQATGTALVPIAHAASREALCVARRHPVAAFVAHLIATHQRAPQTRARRRADPADAVAAYRAAPDLSAKACASLRSL
jgi:hypothetical protein